MVLAVKRILSPHTADNIASCVDECLTEWGISEEKVHRILTDNGSNMVAAFCNDAVLI